ncbi:MAG: hypothetical protein ACRCV9_17950 [Burkholderiaceae bacterium]
MPEILSRQQVTLAGNASGPGKVRPSDTYGRKRTIIIETPAVHAIALNDTMGSGFKLPTGARLLSGSTVNVLGAGAASSTASIGLRNFDTKVASDATAVASAVALTTAARVAANNGTGLGNGVLVGANQELYVTFTGAAPTANQQIRFEIEVAADD